MLNTQYLRCLRIIHGLINKSIKNIILITLRSTLSTSNKSLISSNIIISINKSPASITLCSSNIEYLKLISSNLQWCSKSSLSPSLNLVTAKDCTIKCLSSNLLLTSRYLSKTLFLTSISPIEDRIHTKIVSELEEALTTRSKNTKLGLAHNQRHLRVETEKTIEVSSLSMEGLSSTNQMSIFWTL